MTWRAFWTAPLSDQVERRLARLADLGERLISVLLFTCLAWRILRVITERPSDVVILFAEGLVVLFILIRRRPVAVSARPLDWLAALVGTAGPMLVAPGGRPLLQPAIAVAVIIFGLFLTLWGKLTLRRSFGLAAANRGVVQTGAYSMLRHPIYAGYLLTYIGFMVNNPTAWNALVYAISVFCMVLRMNAEEKVLALDPLYADFMRRVRYRLAPGLY